MWHSIWCLISITIVIPTISQSENMKRFRSEQLLKFITNEIVPDVLPHPPKRVLIVDFFSGASATMGNKLTPTQVKSQPMLSWPTDPRGFYTVCMIDPDAPSRKNPTLRQWQHWLVVNVPSKDVKKGEVLSEYVGAGPPLGTGLHRYVILVYKQRSRLTFDEPHLTNMSAANREKFSIQDFAAKYGMKAPVAGNFFQAKYDDYVPVLNMQLGL